MKEFLKKRYNILIPVFLVVVILIGLFLYTREYKNNRYANEKEEDVYQYFAGTKLEYKAVVGRNKKNVILSYRNKDFDVSLDSTPVYLKDKKAVIFPREMEMFFPLVDKGYQVNALAEVYEENGLYYLNLRNLNKNFDHAFLYDGKNLYFFLDDITLMIGDKEINLSPMSYLSCSYLNFLEYYDKETDTYEQIDLDSGNVTVLNDYMKVDVCLDKVIYEKSFTLLTSDFGSLLKITDIKE